MNNQVTTCINQVFVPVYEKVSSMYGIRAYRCGKCPNCKKARQFDLSIRLIKELRYSLSAKFLTWTISNENYPDDITPSGYSAKAMRMVDRAIQNIRNYHRSAISRNVGRVQYVLGFPVFSDSRLYDAPVRYIVVPELGSHTKRLHFHVIIFNVHPDVWSHYPDAWQNGFVHYGSVTAASCNYAVKYVTKYEDMIKESGKRMRLRMSQGLGTKYISDISKSLIQNDSFQVTYNGSTVSLPRYLRNKVGYSKPQIIKHQHEVLDAMFEKNQLRFNEALNSSSMSPEFYLSQINFHRANIVRQKSMSHV